MSFHFTGTQGHSVHCNLHCQQCTDHTKSGMRCKRRTCKALPFCYQHAKAKGLQIKDSTIPHGGLGLFATKNYANRELIAEYIGDHHTNAQMQQRYGDHTAPYAIQAKQNDIIDATCRRGYAAYVNAPRGTNLKANAELKPSSRGNERIVNMRATTNIPAGREILTTYGAGYWRDKTYDNHWQGAKAQFLTKKYKIR